MTFPAGFAGTLAGGAAGRIVGAAAAIAPDEQACCGVDSASARGTSLRSANASLSCGGAVEGAGAGMSLAECVVTGGSSGTVCKMPKATAPIVAAAASGIHQRCGRVAS
jgi:hypothetical protein